jgi:hypothetical protein
MKILILGKGKIAAQLNLLKPDYYSINNYSIRDLMSKSIYLNNYKTELQSAEIIIFLGYHHRSFFGNCILLLKTLNYLKKIKWDGAFIFFNTQSSLAESIIKKNKEDSLKRIYDIYSVTKKMQSRILGIFEKHLHIYELFLPVVIGNGTSASKFYDKLNVCEQISLPNNGCNKIAFLDVDLLSKWLWTQIGDLVVGGNSKLERKLFLYEFISTPYDIISMNNEREDSSFDSIIFNNLNMKYEYSNSVLIELKFRLKKSVIGLFGEIFKQQIFKLMKEPNLNIANEIINKEVKNVYIANEEEYFFYSRNIYLELIPFRVLKINRY